MNPRPAPIEFPEHKRGDARAYALPPAVELAERLLNGETAEEIATSLHITPTALTRRLNRSGYSASGATLNARRTKANKADFQFAAQDWMDEAECATIPGDLWFSPDAMDRSIAVAVCQTCPVRRRCLEYAIDTETHADGLPVGIWGGLTATERHTIIKGQR